MSHRQRHSRQDNLAYLSGGLIKDHAIVLVGCFPERFDCSVHANSRQGSVNIYKTQVNRCVFYRHIGL